MPQYQRLTTQLLGSESPAEGGGRKKVTYVGGRFGYAGAWRVPAEAQAGFTLVRECPLLSEVPLVGGVNIGESAVNACGGGSDPVWKSV